MKESLCSYEKGREKAIRTEIKNIYMYMKQRCWSKRCNSNVYCRDILLFLLLYHTILQHAYTTKGNEREVDITCCMVFHTYIGYG